MPSVWSTTRRGKTCGLDGNGKQNSGPEKGPGEAESSVRPSRRNGQARTPKPEDSRHHRREGGGRECPDLAGGVQTRGEGQEGRPWEYFTRVSPGHRGGQREGEHGGHGGEHGDPAAQARGAPWPRSGCPPRGRAPAVAVEAHRPVGTQEGGLGRRTGEPTDSGQHSTQLPAVGRAHGARRGDFRVGPPQAGPYLPLPERGVAGKCWALQGQALGVFSRTRAYTIIIYFYKSHNLGRISLEKAILSTSLQSPWPSPLSH